MDKELHRALQMQQLGEADESTITRLGTLLERVEGAALALELQHGRPGGKVAPYNPERSPSVVYGYVAAGGQVAHGAEEITPRDYVTGGFVENRGAEELLLTVEGWDETLWRMPLPAGRVFDLTPYPWRTIMLDNSPGAQDCGYTLLAR